MMISQFRSGALTAVVLAVGVAAASALGVFPASPAHAVDGASGAGQPCVLIDTDFDIDDLMAIPQVIANRRVAAIITTEGYALPAQAASAAMKVFGQPGLSRDIPVIVGASYPGTRDTSEWPWLLSIRDSMARANDLFAVPLMPDARTPASPGGLPSTVDRLVRDCSSVDVLVIGAFTSFVKYSPRIRAKITSVVMQSKPLRGDPTQRPGHISFNCQYDLSACETAFSQLRGLRAVWVDVPRDGPEPYAPNLAMAEGLRPTGLPGSVRAALLSNLSTWEVASTVDGNKSLLWDQSASTYLLHPKLYAKVGGHWEPTIPVETFRRLWTESINRWNPRGMS